MAEVIYEMFFLLPLHEGGEMVYATRRGVRHYLATVLVPSLVGGGVNIEITGVEILLPRGGANRLGLFVTRLVTAAGALDRFL